MSVTSPPPKVPVVRSRLTTASVLSTVVLIALAAACQPKGPTVDEYRSQSPTLARAETANGRPLLRIGVQDDLPFMSTLDPVTDTYRGFDVEIAKLLAHKLGYTRPEDYDFVPLTTEERISALQSGEVHLVVADFTMTEERRKFVRFAGPYLLTTPEIMIRKEDRDRIKTIDDLKKVKVCTTGGSTSSQVLTKYGIKHSLLTKGVDCAEGVRNGTYDAHCTDDVVIAGFVHQYPDELFKVNMPFADTEPLGIGIPLNDEYLETLVAHFLRKERELGTKSQWQAAYNTYLGPVLGPAVQPPLIGEYKTLADHDDAALAARLVQSRRRRRARR